MTRRFRLLLFFVAVLPAIPTAARAADSQKSFATVVYIPVAATVKMKDHPWLTASWANISSQVHVDKVYIETYRRRGWRTRRSSKTPRNSSSITA